MHVRGEAQGTFRNLASLQLRLGAAVCSVHCSQCFYEVFYLRWGGARMSCCALFHCLVPFPMRRSLAIAVRHKYRGHAPGTPPL